MMKPARAWAVGAVLLALAAWASGGSGAAADKESVNPDIRKVAALLKEGDEAGAKKLAAAIAKKVSGLDVVMQAFKPRTKKGLGIGPKAGVIRPDGIEGLLIGARRIRPAQLTKDADAFAQMGYDSAAIAEIALQSPPEKDEGKKTKKAWSDSANAMKKAALDLAKAKGPAAAKAALNRLNSSCTQCHNIFRE